MSLASAHLQRGVAVRTAIAVGLLAIVLFVLPHTAGADWITTFTSVAIYSVVALGFGILYGRVGLISLGQVALLTIGCWIGTRLAYATSLPFPLLLLLAGGITCAIGVLVGLPALRLSGLYLALITLMFAGATTIVLSQRRRRLHRPLEHRRPDDEHAARAAPFVGGRRRCVLPLHGNRVRDPVPDCAGPRRGEARARLGNDS